MSCFGCHCYLLSHTTFCAGSLKTTLLFLRLMICNRLELIGRLRLDIDGTRLVWFGRLYHCRHVITIKVACWIDIRTPKLHRGVLVNKGGIELLAGHILSLELLIRHSYFLDVLLLCIDFFSAFFVLQMLMLCIVTFKIYIEIDLFAIYLSIDFTIQLLGSVS